MRYNFSVVFALVVLTLPSTTNGQVNFWEHTRGPYGTPWISAIARDSGLGIYAGTSGCGIFKSTNAGLSWKYLGLDAYTVNCIAVLKGGVLFAATSGGGQVTGSISIDGGESWNPVPAPGGIRSVCSTKSGRIIVGTSSALYYSVDQGATWLQAAQENGYIFPEKYFVTPSGIVIAKFGSTRTQPPFPITGVFRSTDEGTTWTRTSSLLPTSFGDGGNGKVLAFVSSAWSVYSSTDDGMNWNTMSDRAPTDVYWTANSQVGEIYAGVINNGGVWKSTDHGMTWTHLLYGTLAGLVVSAEGYIIEGDMRAGVYRSTDTGATWSQTSTGIDGGTVVAVGTGNANIVLCSMNSAIYCSSDRGDSWVKAPVVGAYPSITLFYRSAVGDIYGMGTRLYKTSDGGGTWQTYQVGPDTLHADFSCIEVNNSAVIEVGTTGRGIFRSTDSGVNWENVGNGLYTGNILSLVRTPQGTLLAGSNSGWVNRSTNDGTLWTPIRIGNTSSSVNCFALLSSGDLIAGTGGLDYMYKSTDDGLTWTPFGQSTIGGGFAKIIEWRPGNLYGQVENGIAKSTDGGATWVLINSGLGNNPGVRAFDLSSSGELYAGAFQTGLHRSIQILSSVHTPAPLANDFVLVQNYPNPFNPSTSIAYSLPHSAFVSLRIFNTLGQEVAFLVNERKDAGYYRVTWNANVPSGVYFYRLQAGEFVETKKMIVLR